MTKVMLIEAARPEEEVRVAILKDGRLDEYDYESVHKQTFKGNIYLAKVVRVEPSLQAAFVEYGNNRHGFLAFSEIHPDYFRIPVGDKERAFSESDDADEAAVDEEASLEAGHDDHDPEDEDERVETVGGERGEDLVPMQKRTRPHRIYKIQEVVKRRQIMLVQVTKEERGNKGAALTTYLSLAGRYCVLMPNAARGGGISRRITDVGDRKRLRSLVSDLQIPDGVSVIVRTAGMDRSKAEIKRDYEYLMRLWTEIREQTLQSVAPHLIYEEADIIKRALRDLYTRDIDGVFIEGEEAYKSAKSFMKTLMPSHAKKIKLYEPDKEHIFDTFHIETQIEDIHAPEVRLPSGGYIVLNPTEALVSIDVNSGRSTKERNIESTALKTNLEAAAEIARQLRLRDLAGLIVIDFIDMENGRYNAAVERMLKDCMASDRARIQIGRISHFGLLELSRQRLRPSLLEASTTACQYCHGTGLMRAVGTQSLLIIKALEHLVLEGRHSHLILKLPTPLAKNFFNTKRRALSELEMRNPACVITFDICDHQVSAQILSADQHILQEISHLPPRRAGEGPLAPMRIEGLVIEKVLDEEEESGVRDVPRQADRSGERSGDGKKRGRVRKRSGQGPRSDQDTGRDASLDAPTQTSATPPEEIPVDAAAPRSEGGRKRKWEALAPVPFAPTPLGSETAPHFVELGTPALSSFVEFSVAPPPRTVPAMLAATPPEVVAPEVFSKDLGDVSGAEETSGQEKKPSSKKGEEGGSRRRKNGREPKGVRLKNASAPVEPQDKEAIPAEVVPEESAPAPEKVSGQRPQRRRKHAAPQAVVEPVSESRGAPPAAIPVSAAVASDAEKKSTRQRPPKSRGQGSKTATSLTPPAVMPTIGPVITPTPTPTLPLSDGAAGDQDTSKRRGWWQKLVE